MNILNNLYNVCSECTNNQNNNFIDITCGTPEGRSFIYNQGYPPNNEGNLGDVYIDVTLAQIYVRAKTRWILLICLLQVGPQASLNTHVFTSYNPGAHLGDLYINEKTHIVYIKTQTGWVQKCDLNKI